MGAVPNLACRSVRWFMRGRGAGQALVFWRLIYIHHATRRQGGERRVHYRARLSAEKMELSVLGWTGRRNFPFIYCTNMMRICWKLQPSNSWLGNLGYIWMLNISLWHLARNAAPYLLSDERDIHSLHHRSRSPSSHISAPINTY